MKKVIFALSCICLGLMSVSCSTDAYDLPETNELKIQRAQKNLELISEENFMLEENNSSNLLKEGDEEGTSTNTEDNTGPVVIPPKKD